MSEENNYNEQEMADFLARKEQERKRAEQNNASAPVDTEAHEMEQVIESAGLGKVDMQNYGPARAEKSDVILGWNVLDLSLLPSMGKFYPADAVLKIRSAKASEIRHFSTMDDNNYIDMEEKLNHIIENCSQFTSSTKRLSYRDILEEDRIILLLSIRDLTFPEPENKLILKGKTEKTKRAVDIELSIKNLVPTEIPEELQKYYDERERTFVIQTKSAGVVRMQPPSIGVMEQVTAYLKDRQEKDMEFDKAFLQVLPYIVSDWRLLTLPKIFQHEVEYKGWDEKKFMVIYRLAERMRIGVNTNLEMEFDGEIAKAPLDFPGGIKSLFIISDLAGELL